MILMALLACDDEFDESNNVSYPLDISLMDKSHSIIGYIYANGSIKDRHYILWAMDLGILYGKQE